jgi:hypothetical protein
MAPNPGRIQKIIDVQLPHPRERTDSGFAAFRRELFEEFHLDTDKHLKRQNMWFKKLSDLIIVIIDNCVTRAIQYNYYRLSRFCLTVRIGF